MNQATYHHPGFSADLRRKSLVLQILLLRCVERLGAESSAVSVAACDAKEPLSAEALMAGFGALRKPNGITCPATIHDRN